MWPSAPREDPGYVSRSAILQLPTRFMNKCCKSSQFVEKKSLTPSGLYATPLLEFGHSKTVCAVFQLCYNRHNKTVNPALQKNPNLDMTCFLYPARPRLGSD